jgi:hypothetical protein
VGLSALDVSLATTPPSYSAISVQRSDSDSPGPDIDTERSIFGPRYSSDINRRFGLEILSPWRPAYCGGPW